MASYQLGPRLQLVEHAIVACSAIALALYLKRRGLKGVVGDVFSGALAVVPGAKGAVNAELDKAANDATKDMFPKMDGVTPVTELPSKGLPRDELIARLTKLKEFDADPTRTFAYAYEVGDDGEHQKLQQEAHNMFMWGNALNPLAFPALKLMETEIVTMALRLLNAPESARGSLTSGGTESILMAVKTYRDLAKDQRGITEPEMIVPVSIHPAFLKADIIACTTAHYFGVKLVFVECPEPSYIASNAEIRSKITKNTVVIVVSAPSYPHGVIDDVEGAATIAREFQIPLHVDACVGGFILPFMKQLGEKIRPFDFAVDGVTSISADVHKYGYASKGASVILYRSEDIRQYQFFAYANWSGGLFISPAALGTRGGLYCNGSSIGGSIASAWASLMALGNDGFVKVVKQAVDTKKYFIRELLAIDGMTMVGESDSPCIAFTHTKVPILAVGDVMEDKFGWKVERQQKPTCLHLSVMPQHAHTKEKFIADIKQSVEIVKKNPDLSKKGSAAIYGMVATVPSTELIEDFLHKFLGKIYMPTSTSAAASSTTEKK